RNSYPQQTGLQETGRQQTGPIQRSALSLKPDVALSKFRKGAPKNSDEESTERRSIPPAVVTPTGFASVGSVLHEASSPTGERGGHGPEAERQRAEKPVTAVVTVQADGFTIPEKTGTLLAVSAPQLGQRLTGSRGGEGAPLYSEDRALVAAHIRDF